ncbi:MAG TPA: type II secretion system F family protein [Anaeromyxobacteraceae bacterium]|nr:type II secretion system F family protein [Anaeromyxobacteraceae bacterium]
MNSMALAIALLLVGAVVLIAVAAWSIRESHRSALERRVTGTGAASAPLAAAAPVRSVLAAAIARFLSPLFALARPRRDEETSHLVLKLTRAGLRGAYASQLFIGGRMATALCGVVIYAVIAVRRTEPLPAGPALGVILFAAGYYFPTLWLARRTRQRQTALEHGLPDMLDLLVTCVEAGLGLDAAMQRVGTELVLAHPLLASELQLTFLEVNAGIRRGEALRRLADRTGVAELKSLAATLNQTETFGTGIAEALRIQADGMRVRRMQQAEERAATVSVRLTIPLVLFILPALLAVIVGPAIINILHALGPVLGGHR